MAIQIPNPGTGNGATGDNEFVLWTKVKDNFTNTTHAASRLVGTAEGQLPLVENIAALTLELNKGVSPQITGTSANLNTFLTPSYRYISTNLTSVPFSTSASLLTVRNLVADRYVQTIESSAFIGSTTKRYRYTSDGGASFTEWRYDYNTANTTKDANGFLKAASPIVKVHADKVVLNEEAEQQNVTFKKNGIGDYTITTESGLSTDGWYIELPKDLNGNPKVAVTLSEVEGVITLKSYKRIFSMENFTFEPDLDNPLDIPDTRWIDLRLNEIPFEMPDDIQTEV